MSALNRKIDFALVFSVKHANPNGDPLDGNRPRTDVDGYGEVSDVCLKRKLRNRLQDEGECIFVQMDERRDDGCRSLRDRADAVPELKKASKGDRELYAELACARWLDVRAFGQVFAFKSGKKKEEADGSDAVSIGVRGPVSIQPAFSVDPVSVANIQITKSVNLETPADPDKLAPDRVGSKHRVDFGLYATYGSINVQAAEKTGFSKEDAEKLKEALRTLFRNDATSARPDGSMEIVKLIWWEHNCPMGQYSSAKVHRLLHITRKDGIDYPRAASDYEITVDELDGLHCEVLDGE